MTGSLRVQSAFSGTMPCSFIAIRTVSDSSTVFSFALQERHQSAVKSMNTGCPFSAATRSSENACHGTDSEKSSSALTVPESTTSGSAKSVTRKVWPATTETATATTSAPIFD